MEIRRGDVWWISFDPSVGGEIQKTRPAVVISNNAANAALNRLVVVPLSSKTEKLYRAEAMVTLNEGHRKAMVDQVTTVSKRRLRGRMGVLSANDMRTVEDVILLHLGIRR